MSKKHFDLNPHNIQPDVWYYEENNGLDVYVHDSSKGILTRFTIPVASIRAYLKRKDKK